MPPDPVDLRVKRAQADINEALGVKPQPPVQNPDIGYGRREDGSSKGRGFYGMLPRTDGLDQSSELSIGVEMDGKQRTIPSMVPGLSAEQLRYLLSVEKPMRPDITQKAVDFAVQRQQQGKGPFAEPNEEGAYRVPRYAQGGSVKAKKKTPSDYVTDAIASGLAVLPAYRGDERAAYQRAKDFTGLLDYTPVGIPQALYEAGGMLGKGARDRSALGTAGGLGMAAIAGLPIPGKKAIKNAVKKSADLAVSGLKDIRPPTDDAWSVIRSNFDAGRVVGDETVPLDKLSYGVSVGEQPQRVKDLAAKISGPDGYFSRPIVDQAGNVLEGQHRVSALASLGVKDIPVRRVQDLFADIDRTKLVEAIKGAGKVAPEHANQIASHIAEMAADAGGAAKVAQEFDLRGPFEKHFLAGLKAIDQPTPARSLTVKELAPPPALAVEPPKGIRAYHGSPHAFDKFDLSKIGTGEGAQSYGHGLYFAENEGVARSYRDTISKAHGRDPAFWEGIDLPPAPSGDDLKRFNAIGASLRANGNFANDADRSFWRTLKAQLDKRESAINAAKPSGHMYEVNIAADPAQFLDWDKPHSQQTEYVRGVLENLGYKQDKAASAAYDDALFAALTDTGPLDLPKQPYNLMGGDIYSSMSYGTKPMGIGPDGRALYDGMAALNGRNPVQASKRMLDAGIPGIRYLDQGSRTAAIPTYPQGFKITPASQTTSGKWMVKSNDYNSKGMHFDTEAEAQAKLDEMFPGFELPKPKETRNFVVFKPELVDILKRYAVPVAGAGTAASALAVDRPEEVQEYAHGGHVKPQRFATGGGAWTRKEGKNPEGGLNAKGRASLRAQGHDIKPPVSAKLAAKSPKAAARRKSFCARMTGMPGPMKDEKGRPTRKALSLRKWDC